MAARGDNSGTVRGTMPPPPQMSMSYRSPVVPSTTQPSESHRIGEFITD